MRGSYASIGYASILMVVIAAIYFLFIMDGESLNMLNIFMAGILFLWIYCIVNRETSTYRYGHYNGGNMNMYIHTHSEEMTGGVESKKMELMDPRHNMREVAKQLILLEDHMAHKPKRCVDCITKHFLMVEGLLEEAITLDKEGNYIEEVKTALDEIKPPLMDLIEKIKTDQITENIYTTTCQIIRKVRKGLALKYVLFNG